MMKLLKSKVINEQQNIDINTEKLLFIENSSVKPNLAELTRQIIILRLKSITISTWKTSTRNYFSAI